MSSAITVLVADDEPDLRLLVRIVFERAGVEVVEEAIDGEARPRRRPAYSDGDAAGQSDASRFQFGGYAAGAPRSAEQRVDSRSAWARARIVAERVTPLYAAVLALHD